MTRRRLLTAKLGLAAAAAGFGRAHAMSPPLAAGQGAGEIDRLVERDSIDVVEANMHGGEGLLRLKFFGFDNAARPNLFITYVIPPGCSEGVHTHRLGDLELGAYDEFYYVLAGSGLVQLGAEQIAVAAGDHVFAPLGLPHGVANPSGEHDLKLLLTAVERR